MARKYLKEFLILDEHGETRNATPKEIIGTVREIMSAKAK
jgi:hypothetical protein